MTAIPFNTLEYAHKLENAGMNKKLAEAQAQAQFEIIQTIVDDHAATKQDVKDIRRDIESLKRDVKEVQKDLTIRLGLMMSSGLFVLIALMKLLHL